MNKIIAFAFICNAVSLLYASEYSLIIPSKNIGIFSAINKRQYYEDSFSYIKFEGGELDGYELYTVYDGHFCHRINYEEDKNDGSLVAQFLAKNFPSYLSKTSGTMKERMIAACKNIDNDEFIKQHKECGSTAAIVLIKDNTAYCGHVGNSRILFEKNGEIDFVTNDHMPDRLEEHLRIEDSGGVIFNNRVSGFLAITRAFGDYVLDSEKKIIIAEPEYQEIQLTNQHKFLMLATKGLWRVMTNEEAVLLLRTRKSRLHDMNSFAKLFGSLAITRGSQDNITVMLINLLS